MNRTFSDSRKPVAFAVLLGFLPFASGCFGTAEPRIVDIAAAH